MENWMLNDSDIFDITENCDCQGVFSLCDECDRKIGRKAQKKLLEYLSSYCNENSLFSVSLNEFRQLIKLLEQLEEK